MTALDPVLRAPQLPPGERRPQIRDTAGLRTGSTRTRNQTSPTTVEAGGFVSHDDRKHTIIKAFDALNVGELEQSLSGASVTIDPALGGVVAWSVPGSSASVTWVPRAPVPAEQVYGGTARKRSHIIILLITWASSGPRTVSIPGQWDGGSQPDWSTTSGSTDRVVAQYSETSGVYYLQLTGSFEP
ncbi:MAG: hypothetical protein ACT6Q8_24210 [Niveispirillum sp.]|uniref:hypothetical protein n=1 Tax=Niveispirillum sp. TaxID=1917217 RepID=UPI004036E698